MIRANKDMILNRKETIRYLGYKNTMPDSMMLTEIEECEKLFLSVADPKYHYDIFRLKRKEEQLMTADESFLFLGNAIKKHLDQCEMAAFACATLAEGIDRLIDEMSQKNMLHALLLDAIANAAIEEVRVQMEHHLQNTWPEYTVTWMYGIGYGDLPLSVQPTLLTKIDAAAQLGVTANNSCILHPLKSISGFIGMSRNDISSELSCRQRGCAVCSRQHSCQFSKSIQ